MGIRLSLCAVFILFVDSAMAFGPQEKPNNAVLFRGGVGNQPKGKPVIIKGEKIHFVGRFYEKGSSPIPSSLTSAIFKSAEASGAGKDNIDVQTVSAGTVSVEGKSVGTAGIRFQLTQEGVKGVMSAETEIQVIPQKDEFPIFFHFVRANQSTNNASVTTNRTDEIGSAEKRQAIIQPMLDEANKYWDQAGITFTAEHDVTGPTDEEGQGLVDSAFNASGEFNPDTVSTDFFVKFNKVGKINVYIVRAIVGAEGSETERGVTHTDAAEPGKNEKVYAGGRLVKKAYGFFISDKAGKEDASHEIGHLMGLKDQSVLKDLQGPGIVHISELDGIDALNHRAERVDETFRDYNIMRGPAFPSSPSPTFLYITDGQAKFARSQMSKLKWGG